MSSSAQRLCATTLRVALGSILEKQVNRVHHAESIRLDGEGGGGGRSTMEKRPGRRMTHGPELRPVRAQSAARARQTYIRDIRSSLLITNGSRASPAERRVTATMPTPPPLVLVTDPGPDPDDVKALLICATSHIRCTIKLVAVVANGGHQARERAALARCILDHLGLPSVPVGYGSAGKPYEARSHEYKLHGYNHVDQTSLPEGQALIVRALHRAPRRSLRFVLVSSLRDFADVAMAHPVLVKQKTRCVTIQGGLQKDETGSWVPDESVNNLFDLAAAAAAYAYCMDQGVPMRVVSRHAVPMIHMGLARSFERRSSCPIMNYLSHCQTSGLVGLWQRLCAGELPARCTKQWYFDTFCGGGKIDTSTLDESTDIQELLNGFVKPCVSRWRVNGERPSGG